MTQFQDLSYNFQSFSPFPNNSLLASTILNEEDSLNAFKAQYQKKKKRKVFSLYDMQLKSKSSFFEKENHPTNESTYRTLSNAQAKDLLLSIRTKLVDDGYLKKLKNEEFIKDKFKSGYHPTVTNDKFQEKYSRSDLIKKIKPKIKSLDFNQSLNEVMLNSQVNFQSESKKILILTKWAIYVNNLLKDESHSKFPEKHGSAKENPISNHFDINNVNDFSSSLEKSIQYIISNNQLSNKPSPMKEYKFTHFHDVKINTFFDEVINTVMRKVSYIDSRNNLICERLVVNLISKELGDNLNKNIISLSKKEKGNSTSTLPAIYENSNTISSIINNINYDLKSNLLPIFEHREVETDEGFGGMAIKLEQRTEKKIRKEEDKEKEKENVPIFKQDSKACSRREDKQISSSRKQNTRSVSLYQEKGIITKDLVKNPQEIEITKNLIKEAIEQMKYKFQNISPPSLLEKKDIFKPLITQSSQDSGEVKLISHRKEPFTREKEKPSLVLNEHPSNHQKENLPLSKAKKERESISTTIRESLITNKKRDRLLTKSVIVVKDNSIPDMKNEGMVNMNPIRRVRNTTVTEINKENEQSEDKSSKNRKSLIQKVIKNIHRESKIVVKIPARHKTKSTESISLIPEENKTSLNKASSTRKISYGQVLSEVTKRNSKKKQGASKNSVSVSVSVSVSTIANKAEEIHQEHENVDLIKEEKEKEKENIEMINEEKDIINPLVNIDHQSRIIGDHCEKTDNIISLEGNYLDQKAQRISMSVSNSPFKMRESKLTGSVLQSSSMDKERQDSIHSKESDSNEENDQFQDDEDQSITSGQKASATSNTQIAELMRLLNSQQGSHKSFNTKLFAKNSNSKKNTDPSYSVQIPSTSRNSSVVINVLNSQGSRKHTGAHGSKYYVSNLLLSKMTANKKVSKTSGNISEQDIKDFLVKTKAISQEEEASAGEDLSEELKKKKMLMLINIDQDLNYQMNKSDLTDTEKKKYEEFREKIDSLKKFDSSSYVSMLEKNFHIFKEEIESLDQIRKIENRLNGFLSVLADYRNKSMKYKELMRSKIHLKNAQFTSKH